jgi:hypothetical protein
LSYVGAEENGSVSLERNLASSTARAQWSRCFYSSCQWTAGAIIKSPHASLKTANSTVSTMSPSSCAPSMQNHIAGCTSLCHHGDSGSSRAASEESGKFGHLPPKPTPYSPYFYPSFSPHNPKQQFPTIKLESPVQEQVSNALISGHGTTSSNS